MKFARIILFITILIIIILSWYAVYLIIDPIGQNRDHTCIYIPYEVEVNGEIYTMEEVGYAEKYHGILGITIKLDKNHPEDNEIYFKRDGIKCALFTDGAKKYIEDKRIKMDEELGDN